MAYGSQNVELEDSVIYSTTGFAESVRDEASTPVIITKREIEEKRYKTAIEALKDVPSVNVQYQMGMPVIDMRGQGMKAKDNVQVLIDGVPVNSLETSMVASVINTISVDSIERIEVIPGGGAVLYGSGTSGGVVNIITKKGTGSRASAGYSYGDVLGGKADVSAGYTFADRLDLDLAYTKNNIKGYRDYSRDESDYFLGSLRYRISEDQRISLKYTKYKNEMQYPGSLTDVQLREDRRQSSLYPGEEYLILSDKDEIMLDYQNKLSDKLELNLLGFSQKIEITMKDNYKIPGESFDMEAHFDTKKNGLKAKLKYTYTEKGALIFGVDYIDDKLDRTMEQLIKGVTTVGPMVVANDVFTDTEIYLKKKTWSAFLLNTIRVNDFELIQGVRYEKARYHIDRSSMSHVHVEGRMGPMIIPMADTTSLYPIVAKRDEDNFALELAANYLYSETGKLYLKYERGFSSPAPALLTDRDATPSYGGSGNYFLNDLKSETFNTVELGFKDYFGPTTLTAAVFYTLTNDEIRSSGMSRTSRIVNYNLAKTERFGFEISAEQRVNRFTFRETYHFVNAKIKDGIDGYSGLDVSGKRIALVPQHKFSVGANVRILPNLSLDADVVYAGNYYLNDGNTGGKKNKRLLVNSRINWEPKTGLVVYAGVNNLFDEKYSNSVDYDPAGGYSYDPAYGRNWYVGFKYQF
ncbi:MAG: TonB-dependent receptor [Fusobacteriaceae bacterium]|jgi:iron complex outermembrane receptor protein|nr:TonB-dependent receptor [Fusobacteriaceae bacterium]